MLIDKITLNISAGTGGDGVVRWRREKGIPYGGPAGGDGGKGGDVYIKVIRDIYALAKYKSNSNIKAENGEAGKKRGMHGGDAKDVVLEMPLGSLLYNRDYDIKYDLNQDGEVIKILKGGRGGLGNQNFKTSTNRTPEEFTKGHSGESAVFDVELRLIADAGFVGKPNTGKSSLLNALTRAGAKVADYPFTTLEPNLGVYKNFILADIPGLIEGASEGKGLGHKFLRHIRRTRVLIHLVSSLEDDPVLEYKKIRKELEDFDEEVKNQREVVVISRSDEVNSDRLQEIKSQFKNKLGLEVMDVSVLDDKKVKDFGEYLVNVF